MMRISSIQLVIALLSFTLSACGGTPATPSTATSLPGAPAPTSVPPGTIPGSTTNVSVTPTPPAASPVPTITPTSTQTVRQSGLPAPVYLISASSPANQIVRLAADGSTLSQISFESRPVIDLSVATQAGSLAYLVGDDSQSTLVILDGSGRRELTSGRLSNPRISPDGQTIIVRIDAPEPGLIIGQEESPSGVWAFPISGGRPSLLIADDPLNDESQPTGAVWSYTPIGYDPSGRRVLLWAYDLVGPAISGGELVILDQQSSSPIRTFTCCEGATWSVDGTAITISGGGPGPDLRYGLYQIAAATGAEQPVIAQIEGSVPLVTGARQLADGQIYALYQQAASDSFSWEMPFTPQMVRVTAAGTITPLRKANVPLGDALWRDDASGVLVTVWDAALDNPIAGRLTWIDSAGSAPIETSAIGSAAAWADTVRPLYAGDCSLLPSIGWQPAASRSFSSGAADLQARLNALGFDAGQPDGYFGDQTRSALQAFQKQHNLSSSDTLDCTSWQILLGRP